MPDCKLSPLPGDWVAFVNPGAEGTVWANENAIKLVGGFLPAFAGRWLDAYERQPAWFLLWACIVGLLIWYGTGQQMFNPYPAGAPRYYNDFIPQGWFAKPGT